MRLNWGSDFSAHFDFEPTHLAVINHCCFEVCSIVVEVLSLHLSLFLQRG